MAEPLTLVAEPVAAPEQIDQIAIKALVRVMEAWRVKNPDAAALIQESTRTWIRMKNGEWAGTLNNDQKMRASALIGLYKGLRLYFSDALADRWPQLPNTGPLFRGLSPIVFMEQGGLPAILDSRKYVDAIRGGI